MAALEFSQLPPSGNVSRARGSKGVRPALRAEDRGGATERGQRESQSLHQGPEDSQGRALNGWGNPVKPSGGTVRRGALRKEDGERGAPPGAFSARDEYGEEESRLHADGRARAFPGPRADRVGMPSREPGPTARDAKGQGPQAKEEGKPPLPAHPQEEKKGGPPTAGRGGRGQGTPQQGPKGGKEEVQVLTEELNRWGLAYVWGLMGLPGGLARIMIDSGNLVGDVVSEEFAQQANLAGEPCRKEIETAAAASKMQIIGRCYPIKLQIAGIGTSFEIQP